MHLLPLFPWLPPSLIGAFSPRTVCFWFFSWRPLQLNRFFFFCKHFVPPKWLRRCRACAAPAWPDDANSPAGISFRGSVGLARLPCSAGPYPLPAEFPRPAEIPAFLAKSPLTEKDSAALNCLPTSEPKRDDAVVSPDAGTPDIRITSSNGRPPAETATAPPLSCRNNLTPPTAPPLGLCFLTPRAQCPRRVRLQNNSESTGGPEKATEFPWG